MNPSLRPVWLPNARVDPGSAGGARSSSLHFPFRTVGVFDAVEVSGAMHGPRSLPARRFIYCNRVSEYDSRLSGVKRPRRSEPVAADRQALLRPARRVRRPGARRDAANRRGSAAKRRAPRRRTSGKSPRRSAACHARRPARRDPQVAEEPRRMPGESLQRLASPISEAFASVWKCSWKPTTAAEVSAVTGSSSSDTAWIVKR